jgi:hypothetical protein
MPRVAPASDAEAANEDQGGANENHKEISMGSRNEKTAHTMKVRWKIRQFALTNHADRIKRFAWR